MRKPHANHVNCVAAYLCSFVKLYTRHKTVALLCFSQSFGKPKGNELFSSPARLNCSPCPWWSLPFCHLTGVFAIKCTSETLQQLYQTNYLLWGIFWHTKGNIHQTNLFCTGYVPRNSYTLSKFYK